MQMIKISLHNVKDLNSVNLSSHLDDKKSNDQDTKKSYAITVHCIGLNQKYFPAQIYAVNFTKKVGIYRTPYFVFYNALGMYIAWFKGRDY